MILWVLDCIKRVFTFAFDVYSRIVVFGSVTLMDFLVWTFMASILVISIAVQFGGRGISQGASSAIHSKHNADVRLEREQRRLETEERRRKYYSRRHN